MRIFIISRGYPTAKEPQWGCFERDQAEALATIGHEVIMLSVDTRFRLYLRRLGVTERTINNVHSINIFLRPSATILGHMRRIRSERIQLKYIFKLAFKKYGKPDIIYSHYLFKNANAVWLAKKMNIPIAGMEHWSELNHKPLSKTVYQLGQITYHRLDAVLAVSHSLSQSIKNNFGEMPIHVIHNMAHPIFKYSPTNSHSLTFIATGSLITRKGFDLLPSAFAKINNIPPNWKLLIIGEGPEQKNIQSQINDLGLQKHIELLGQKTKEEIVSILQQSDAFILPSRNENFSVAVLEALACGVPVIASICGGIKECINTQNGLLFEVDDVDGLTECIQHIVDHPNQFNHRAIADDYIARFSPPVIAQQLTSIFEETISKYHK